MRIWIISSSYPRHPEESINAGVLAREVALGAAALGHDITVITPDKPGGVEFDDAISGVTVPWPRPTVALSDLNPRRPGQAGRAAALLVSARRIVGREARRRPPDGIIALWALPSGMFARWASRVANAPYANWLLGSDVWRAARIPLGVRTLRSVLEGAAANFADGSELAAEATRLTGQHVDVMWSARRLPPQSGHAAPPVDVLFVGRYHRNKGPDVLMNAIARLPIATTVRFHGHGDLHESLVAAAGVAGRPEAIREPIDAATLAAALRECRLLAIPSRIESVPLVLGDAIQAGTAIVATDVGDMGDIVTQFQLGEVVVPENPDEMAAAISRVLASDRYPDPHGLQEARSRFSVDSIAAALIDRLT